MGELKAITGFSARQFDRANEGCRLLIRNVELARRLNDPEAFLWAANSMIYNVSNSSAAI
jgi:hypothetical protein